MSTARIEPLLPDAWDAQALDALGAFPRSLDFVMSRWKDTGTDVRGMHILGVLAKLNKTADYLHATYYWHIDGAQDDVPTRASLLTARKLSSVGGQTEFANTYAAYEDLSADEKREYEKLKVYHSQETIQRKLHPNPTDDQLERWRSHPTKLHPLAWTHQSGRKSLVLGLTASHVDGMPQAEGHALLERLQAWATQPQFVYRHHWTVFAISTTTSIATCWPARTMLQRWRPR